MHETFRKGQLAVLKIQERALEKDIVVCVPTVECRFDLVLVYPCGKIERAQVKYADAPSFCAAGCVVLDLRKQTRGRGDKKAYTRHEIDVLLVYMPKTAQVLKFEGVDFHEAKTLTIRYEPPLNGATKGIRLAQNYFW